MFQQSSNTPVAKKYRWGVSQPFTSLMLLFALFIFFLLLMPMVTGLLTKICHRPESAMRISIVLQDIFVFIIPAIVTALLATKLPARLLAIDRLPSFSQTLYAIGTLIFSIPLMNVIIDWNQNLHLPDSLSSIESMIRQMEQQAESVTNMLLAGANVWSLILSILIVGVLAALSEELLFRGALLRLLRSGRVKVHIAVWLSAIIFSTLHMQFFGFVPRMLLGALFGYLLYWSGSLWLPVIIHALNNSLVVVFTYLQANNNVTTNFDKIGTSSSEVILVIASALLTAGSIWLLWRNRTTNPE